MERLTERELGGDGIYVRCNDYVYAAYRLADYEDTNLSPEEITSLQESWNMYGGEDGITAELEELQAYRALGSLDHLRELVQAEKDGLLVVLPCKIGDPLYFVKDREIRETEVESIHQWVSGHWKLSTHTDRMSPYWTGYEIDFEGIGKTVFLTREEAEAALEGSAK